MLFVFIYMAVFNETTYKQLRRLVGLPYMKGSKRMPAEPPSNPEAVTALLQKTNVTGLVVVGYIIPAIVLWLMIFKPFLELTNASICVIRGIKDSTDMRFCM